MLKNLLIRIAVNSVALWVASELVDGIRLSDDLVEILIVALVFGLLNALLKPIVLLFSFPFLLLTLGLFAFVVNGAMLLLTARLTPYLEVSGFVAAILGSIVVSFVTIVLGWVLTDD